MERQLFDWVDWDGGDEGCYQFYTVKLVVKIGPYPSGTVFATAAIDFQKGTLEFYNGREEPVAKFKLKLQIES